MGIFEVEINAFLHYGIARNLPRMFAREWSAMLELEWLQQCHIVFRKWHYLKWMCGLVGNRYGLLEGSVSLGMDLGILKFQSQSPFLLASDPDVELSATSLASCLHACRHASTMMTPD